MKLRAEIKKVNEKFYTNKETNEQNSFLEVLFEERNEQYPESVLVTVFGDKKENFNKYNKVGDYGDLQFNLRAKEAKDGRIFNQHNYFRFDKVQAEAPATATEEDNSGDLPF